MTLNDLDPRNGRYFALFQRIRVASAGALRNSSRSLSQLLLSYSFASKRVNGLTDETDDGDDELYDAGHEELIESARVELRPRPRRLLGRRRRQIHQRRHVIGVRRVNESHLTHCV